MKFLNYFLISAFVSFSAIANTSSEEEKLARALEEIFDDADTFEDDSSSEED
jgi:hypothetical protein